MDSSTVRPARLRVGLIGAGRAGSVVTAALARAGHQVVAVSAVSDKSKARAAQLLPQAAVCDPLAVCEQAELVVLAVPDDALADLVTGLVRAGAISAGKIVVHLSGRFGSEVLAPAHEVGALCVALHPVMTLTGEAYEVDRLDGCPFGISASEESRPVAEALVVEMGGEPQWIEPDARVLYHAALSHASNHLVTLIAQSQDMLAEAGIENPGQFLGPLTSASLDNALRWGDGALTGPVSRGDAATVASHVSGLADAAHTAAERSGVETYVALAKATAIRAANSQRITAGQADAVLDALASDD